ncbi:MAG: diguanylate cyclase [Rhodanobacteraceae bacterium]|nr:diguanylate cyclase [Rhodanobacteraceae bacterium]
MSNDQTTYTLPTNAQWIDEGHYTACLVVIRGAGTGNKILLNRDTLVIGRADDADLQLPKAGVSRRHAIVERVGEQAFRIKDLGSTNGTYINAARVDEATLKDQDVIAIGETRLKFLSADSPEQPYYEALYSQAQLDKALQVYNKHYFLTRLDEELRRHRVIGAPLSLVMLDVDHFKRLNDTYGHLVGDAALVHLVALVKGRIRDSDVFCRYGGEEFALILPQTPTQQALEVAEQLRALVANAPLQHADKVINMTISLGISDAADLATVPEAMIQRADRALYHAKRTGRNKAACHEPGMDAD